jgi:hypothetical protein
MVRYTGFEPTEPGLSRTPLPIGVLARGASRWIRTNTVGDFKFPASADWATDACGIAGETRTRVCGIGGRVPSADRDRWSPRAESNRCPCA